MAGAWEKDDALTAALDDLHGALIQATVPFIGAKQPITRAIYRNNMRLMGRLEEAVECRRRAEIIARHYLPHG